MKFPWRVKEVNKTPAEEKLEEIRRLLFPPLQLREDEIGFKYHVDYSVDSNLDAVLMDLQDGENDAIVQHTVKTSIEKIAKVREILEAYSAINKEAKYLIVDNDEEEIKAAELD